MESEEEVVEILEAVDETGSFRDVGGLAGRCHRTVELYAGVRFRRVQGRPAVCPRQPMSVSAAVGHVVFAQAIVWGQDWGWAGRLEIMLELEWTTNCSLNSARRRAGDQRGQS
jgi:hypothetical protein